MKFQEDLNKIIVFVYEKKYITKKIDLLIKDIFIILDKYYNYKINNSYYIKLYINKLYGMILEISLNDSLTDKNISVKLKILNDVLFLYEIDDPLKYLDNEIYYYNNKYFVNLKKENINIFENSNIIYGNDVYKIIGKGIKI